MNSSGEVEVKARRIKRYMLLSGVVLLFSGGCYVAVIAVTNFISMGFRAKRAELPHIIQQIRSAQIAYEAKHNSYVTCPPYPATPTKTTQQWEASQAIGFSKLGWKPDGDIRGVYGVTVTSSDFNVLGISDLDGDGVFATYMATKSEEPRLLTPSHIY